MQLLKAGPHSAAAAYAARAIELLALDDRPGQDAVQDQAGLAWLLHLLRASMAVSLDHRWVHHTVCNPG